MTKRVQRLLLAGGVMLAIAVMADLELMSWVRSHSPQGLRFGVRPVYWESESKGASITPGYDAPGHRIAHAIRIDVRSGIPFGRDDDKPIKDVTRYVTARLDSKEEQWVVVTGGNRETLGNILKVIDACRPLPISAVVVNVVPLESAE